MSDKAYIRENKPGLDWARNRAILEARGEIIAYTDDDVVVDPIWARSLAELFSENPSIMAATGLIVPYELETEPQLQFEIYGGFGRGYVRQWHSVNVPGGERAATFHAGTGKFGTGANMAYRRSLFEEIGMFDPALDVGTVTNGGGDIEMFFRVLQAGYTLAYEPRALVRHRHRRAYESFHKQITNNGIGLYSYFVRSFLAFPGERYGILRLGIWWFLYWNVRRWLLSFVKPMPLPRSLIWGELAGSIKGLTRYQKARRNAQQLGAGKLPVVMRHKRKQPNNPQGMAVRQQHLEQPISDIADVSDYPNTRVYIFREGKPLGFADIANNYGPISARRLREALVDALFVSLLAEPENIYDHIKDTIQKHYTAPKNAGLSTDVSISIVIATFDRPDDLRECLASLVQQEFKRPYEIIVVDNHPSSGKTAPVVAEFPQVRLVQEERQGLAYARNKGFIVSRGDITISTDDDVLFPPNWVEQIVKPFARDEVMIVTGNVFPRSMENEAQRYFEIYGGLGRGFRQREANGEWFSAIQRRAVPTWDLGATANAAFRRTIFTNPQIGLMHEALGPGTPTGVGEDTYLFYKTLKAGYTVVYQPHAYVWHKHRRDLPALRRQIYNYSKGHISYHMMTLLADKDKRAAWHIGYVLPVWQVRQVLRSILKTMRGSSTYPLSLILLEIRGNLAAPWNFVLSMRRRERLGTSQFEPINSQPLEITAESGIPALAEPVVLPKAG